MRCCRAVVEDNGDGKRDATSGGEPGAICGCSPRGGLGLLAGSLEGVGLVVVVFGVAAGFEAGAEGGFDFEGGGLVVVAVGVAADAEAGAEGGFDFEGGGLVTFLAMPAAARCLLVDQTIEFIG